MVEERVVDHAEDLGANQSWLASWMHRPQGRGIRTSPIVRAAGNGPVKGHVGDNVSKDFKQGELEIRQQRRTFSLLVLNQISGKPSTEVGVLVRTSLAEGCAGRNGRGKRRGQ
jgi:hypothetical protein